MHMQFNSSLVKCVLCSQLPIPRVTALFVYDDYLGMIVHTALTAMGLAVPRDMSIICPGDVMDYSEPFYPRLTTMHLVACGFLFTACIEMGGS